MVTDEGSSLRRADRLFRIVEYLKARRQPVTANVLAEELDIGVRTIYRDIADLKASGIPLTGEAGIGYLLRQNYVLRPLLFDAEELAALSLGAQMVESWADPGMAESARRALDKIAAVLPDSLGDHVREPTAFAYPSEARLPLTIDFTSLRRAIHSRHIVEFSYVDEVGAESTRRLRPLALTFFAPKWLVVGWCELRRDFRNFRVDRMRSMNVLEEHFKHEPGKTLADLHEQCT